MTSERVPSLSTIEVDATTDPRWAEVTQSHQSDVFHSPAWARVLADGYGLDVRAFLVVDERGTPVAGLPYVDVDGPRGRRIVSLPFSDFCDPLVSDGSEWDLLVSRLPLSEVPVTVRVLRDQIALEDDRWSETAGYAWHRVDTTRDIDDTWDGLHSSARRAIRKARSSGVEVMAAATEDDLRAFFDLHLRVRKHKYGLLAQPYRFFEAIWEHFLSPGRGRLLLARAGGELVGGVLYLEWRSTLYYKFNASDSSRLDVRPNDLLVWEGIRHAHEKGLRWFDFGVSDWDQDGLVRYKRKYATEEGVVRRLSAGPPSDDTLGPYLGKMTELLVDPSVPDDVTEKAGDLFYHLFC